MRTRPEQALVARNKKGNISNIARDCGVALPALEAFITGTAPLAPDVLKKLADYIFQGHAEYVPELDLLPSTNR